MRKKYKRRSIKERFWSKVDKGSKCWVWTAGTNRGYGEFWIEDRMHKAHRISYEMEYRSVPPSMCVLHTCDNPPCVNPKHLFVGSQKDNIADAHSKGRLKNGTSLGSMHWCSKLTEKQVSIILKDTRTHRKIAKEYKVSRSTVSLIKQRKTWKHVREN